jgi:hypothetical protein
MSGVMIDFKPSEIDPFARSLVPFVATFRHAESEVFAAMLVGALVMYGDEWRPVVPREIGLFLAKMTGDAGRREEMERALHLPPTPARAHQRRVLPFCW